MSRYRNPKITLFAAFAGVALSVVAGNHADADWMRADIAGRWLLHTPARGYCVMGFSGAPESAHGTVAAMGLCPPVFLSRPRWLRDGDRVVITNRRGDILADLDVVGRGYLKGQLATGEAVSLVR